MIPAILDHLWQSTLVALAAGLLAAAFRKAAASVRFGLWLAASLKFLVPFAALQALGGWLAPALGPPAAPAPEAVLVERAAAPFSQAYAAPAIQAGGLDPFAILTALWALGCGAVLVVWVIRLARIRRVVRSSTPLAWPAPMPVLASSAMLEPGLVGLWRPVLVVPVTLSDHLAKAEIGAIVAHESCHLRRRDNLIATVHMLVEALFWFHPLVWWIGARLIEERERACDEAVVRSGHDRAAYARSLVECCRLYLRLPLPCVAGAAGPSLKTRVRAIMTQPPSPPLTPLTRSLLVCIGLCVFATPVTAGLLASPAGRQTAARAVAIVAGVAPALGGAAADPAPAAGLRPVARQTATRTLATRTEATPMPNAVMEQAASPDTTAEPSAAQPAPRAATAPVAQVEVKAPILAAALDPVPAKVQAALPTIRIADKDDPQRVVCRSEAVTGSRFLRRVCMTQAQWTDLQLRLDDFQRHYQASMTDQPNYPAIYY
jgi:beta-lactamase regulating signal transducer with metallopeptidase domain